MNHITNIEIDEIVGSFPVGHYEFAAVTGKFSGFNDQNRLLCFKFLNYSGDTVFGTLEIDIMCEGEMAKYRIPVALDEYSRISSAGPYVYQSTSSFLKCSVIRGRIGHEEDGGVETKKGVIALLPAEYGWWQITSVKATFNARNVEIVVEPNVDATNVDSKVTVGSVGAMSLLTSGYDFGTELPDPGNSGRIFFLEVQDE